MNISVNRQNLILFFLGSLCLTLIPAFFSYYLVAMLVALKVFVIVCIIDYFKKTALRKNFGLVLAVMVLVIITSIMLNYFKGNFGGA